MIAMILYVGFVGCAFMTVTYALHSDSITAVRYWGMASIICFIGTYFIS